MIGKIVHTGETINLWDQKTIKLITYADDIVIVTRTEEDIWKITQALIEENAKIGLTVSTHKT